MSIWCYTTDEAQQKELCSPIGKCLNSLTETGLKFVKMEKESVVKIDEDVIVTSDPQYCPINNCKLLS